MTDRPTPPADLPADLRDRLVELTSDQLDAVSTYATDLAAVQRAAQAATDGTDDEESVDGDDSPDDDPTEPLDPPDDVPSKATIVVKTINDNRYYYWQWRDGDAVKSKYEGPVDPDG